MWGNQNQKVRATLIGVFRDLRGIAMATNSRRTYGLLFDWLYPKYMPLLLRAAAVSARANRSALRSVFLVGSYDFFA